MQINREMRGMRRQEIMDYFSQLDEMVQEDSVFYSKKYRVEIKEESVFRIGSLSFPATVVLFIGDEEFIKAPLRQFELRFMTAGG